MSGGLVMNTIKLLPKRDISHAVLTDFFTFHWGSTEMVLSSGIYDCSQLDGFTVINDKHEVIGLITYIMRENECEIISLDSVVERKGIGTQLLKTVEKEAKNNGCELVKLITTNDNMAALKFYQKRGYCLAKIFNHAVEEARKLKPEIPLIGNGGIPIRDEILLEKMLT